jgi:hypothetical protein
MQDGTTSTAAARRAIALPEAVRTQRRLASEEDFSTRVLGEQPCTATDRPHEGVHARQRTAW